MVHRLVQLQFADSGTDALRYSPLGNGPGKFLRPDFIERRSR